MTGQQFNDALIAKGWISVETANGYKFTSPLGEEFIYYPLEAITYGTWFDVERCSTARLPQL